MQLEARSNDPLIKCVKPTITRSLINFFLVMLVVGLPWSFLLLVAFWTKNETIIKIVQVYLGFSLLAAFIFFQIQGAFKSLLPLGRRAWAGGVLVLGVYVVFVLLFPLIGLIMNPSKNWEFFVSAAHEPLIALSQLGAIGLAAGILQFLGGMIATIKSIIANKD